MLHIPKKRKNSPLVGHSFYAPLPAIKTRTARYLSPTSVCLDSFSLLTARTGILHAKTFLIAVLCNIVRRSFPHVRNKPFSLLEVIKWHFDHEIWNKAVHVYNPCFTNISVGIIIIGTNLIVFIWIFMMSLFSHKIQWTWRELNFCRLYWTRFTRALKISITVVCLVLVKEENTTISATKEAWYFYAEIKLKDIVTEW